MLIIPDACLGVKYDNVVVHRLPMISHTFLTIDIKKNSEVVRPEAAGLHFRYKQWPKNLF